MAGLRYNGTSTGTSFEKKRKTPKRVLIENYQPKGKIDLAEGKISY
jgi:hypothetical protein